MRSYLDLVPIFAKAHGKQSRMSVFCIVLSVFLVTVIFGMADMFIRSQILQAQKEYGNWHIAIRDIDDAQAEEIASRPDVSCISCYGILNYRGEDGYTLGGKSVAIMGCEEGMLTRILEGAIAEGHFPETDNEAMVSLNVKKALELDCGETISVLCPDGSARRLAVTGFIHDTANLLSEDSYGVCMNTAGYRALYPAAGGDEPADYNSVFHVQFAATGRIQSSIDGIMQELGLRSGQVSENTQLMALLGQGSNSFTMQIYGAAAILFVLVLLAGIMMITSSLNSNVAGRIQFFGMLRCIGATKKQVARLVRREALRWCLAAIPLGVAAGVILVWGLCFVLRMLSPDYFGEMPVFGVSLPSVLAGCMLGLLTVFLAARAPAKKAAKASPLAAASGNAGAVRVSGKGANTRLFSIDVALGIQHAKESKKNYILMSGSFALSIILFLGFSVTIAFMERALKPLSPWTPDLSVSTQSDDLLIPPEMIKTIQANPAVEKAYGRMAANALPASMDGVEALVHLISYEETQFGWAREFLLEGSVDDVQEKVGAVMRVYAPQSPSAVGSEITLEIDGRSAKITVAGVLSDSPFNTNDGGVILIGSEETLRQVAGICEYAVVDVQLKRSATEADVDAIRAYAGERYRFADERLSNSGVRGSYYSFGLFIYGFLALIALVAIFNIVNSIAMSVAARTKQYGVLRAVGLSGGQLARMIVSEAVTYSATGTVFGTVIGICINRLLFYKLVSYNWGSAWRFPCAELAVILAVIVIAVLVAIRKPIRRINGMSIVDTIGAP